MLKTLFKKWQREGKHACLVRVASSLYRWTPAATYDFFSIVSNNAFRDELNSERSLSEWVDFIFSALGGTVKPLQKKSEILQLVTLLKSRNSSAMLEIGTANGGTLFLLCRALSPEGLLVSVDLPGGLFGGGYPPWRKRLYRQFASPGQHLELIRADSHSHETFSDVKQKLGGREFDFILIDGDHTYEGARSDFEMYRTLLKDDGLIAFHDIVKHGDPSNQVYRLWQDLKNQFEVMEFVEDWEQFGCGIGVITDASTRVSDD